MSDTLISAIIGAVIGGILTGVATYLIARGQWKRDKEAARAQWEQEKQAEIERQKFELKQAQEEQRSALIDYVWRSLNRSFIPRVIERSVDDDYIAERVDEFEETLKYLWGKGYTQNNNQICKAADDAAILMRTYFALIRDYGHKTKPITEEEIETYRQNTKVQVGDILSVI